MHIGTALIAAVCIIVAGFLLLASFQGSTYSNNLQAQVALATVIVALAALIMFIAYKAVKSAFFKVQTGKEALIGATGVATSDLKPKGEVRVLGEFWQATANSGWINKGEDVEVVGMEGLFLVVKPAKERFNH
jgi:membrane-bound serine protease (ClpP class)